MSFPNIYKFSDIHSAFVSWFHSIVWRKESWYDFNFKFVKTCFVKDCYMYIWEECMFCCCWMAFSLFLLGLVWYMVFKSPDSLLIICVDTVSTIEYGVSSIQFISVQLLSRIKTFCDPIDCSTPDFLVHHQIPELTQTHVHWVSDAIQPSHPLSSPSPPTFNLSQHQGLFQWVSSSHQMARVLEFQLQHQCFQWILKTLISFRMDWSDLLAVQGTLKRLLQHHSSKASILWHSAFFIV